MGSKTPPAPAAPDYAAANREGILADIETLPARRQIEYASRLGQAGSFMLDGKEYSYDFGGLGDEALATAQAGIDRSSAFGQAQNMLDIQEQYGQRFLENSRDQLKASDPIGFALREKMGQNVTDDLALGRSVSDGERRNVQQAVRGQQTARGNISGVAAATQEVMAQSQFGENRYQQRTQNAGAFLAGTTPLSQFGQLQGAARGAAPYRPSGVSGIGQNMNAGNQAAQFAQQSFGTQAQVYNTQMSNQSNPWMEGLGMAVGTASQIGAASLTGGGSLIPSLTCWVAREVYGEDNPKWKEFRSWVLNDADEDFREFYLANGEKIAESIKDKPEVKASLRKWMDTKIKK
jgi:hypothetical protein